MNLHHGEAPRVGIGGLLRARPGPARRVGSAVRRSGEGKGAHLVPEHEVPEGVAPAAEAVAEVQGHVVRCSLGDAVALGVGVPGALVRRSGPRIWAEP